MKTFLMSCDPGHAWLRVSRKDLDRSGVADMVSEFSYVSSSGKHVWLEEDCDAERFLSALKAQGIEFTIKARHSNNYSRIRNLSRYYSLSPTWQGVKF